MQLDLAYDAGVLTLEQIVKDKRGYDLFRTFLLQELSHENLDFFSAVAEYKADTNAETMLPRAQVLFDEFVPPGAPHELNLPGPILKSLEHFFGQSEKKKQKKINPKIFDEAQRSVFFTIEKDSFRRFIRTPEFQSWKKEYELAQPMSWVGAFASLEDELEEEKKKKAEKAKKKELKNKEKRDTGGDKKEKEKKEKEKEKKEKKDKKDKEKKRKREKGEKGKGRKA
eukprot:TRINITY_DN2785_c0_g1_i1.p1 TRINITY_DN2785_c0_g1~~TRINITY_DN2785_c0_g1_i1.p1  ORF type:complete len:237 (+),score=98.50 TRINITY_DN2785_c0_g1_i1:36-713(+)